MGTAEKSVHESLMEKYLAGAERFGIYDRYPDISDRKAWEGLPKELKRELIKEGEGALEQPWTELLISDFTAFKRTGNRVRFEDKYFPRRRKLNKLVMAECVENKGRFLGDILDGLYLILEETTWCLPPHTSYERDGQQEIIPDVRRQIIDLFQAESGAEVAYLEYLLRPVLDRISPHIGSYVNERLRERIFEPYLGSHFWWMGDGKQTMCNWTPWITQNVLICALTRKEDFFTEAERQRFMEKAARSCDYFLDEYGEDGGCNEGAQYYSHAGLCLFGCLELMDRAVKCPGFNEIFKEPKIKNIAGFIAKMYVGNGYYVNFADCSPLAGRRSAREFLFGRAVGDDYLAGFAASDYRASDAKDRLISDEINLFYHVMQAFAAAEMESFPESDVTPGDVYFRSMGLMVARDRVYTLAAKAGDNGDSHNHNDVGSFTLYKNGRPFVIDLGVGTYTGQTFSDRRYELWTMQSQFHNLPTFAKRAVGDELGRDPAADAKNPDIIMEKDGKEYCAADVNCILCTNIAGGSGKEVSSLKMDIRNAYDLGDKGGDETFSYERTIALHKNEGVVVTDKYTGQLPVYMSIMTYMKPVISGDSFGEAVNIDVGDLGSILVTGGVKKVRISEYPITDDRLSAAWKGSVYRILLEMEETATDYEFRLL